MKVLNLCPKTLPPFIEKKIKDDYGYFSYIGYKYTEGLKTELELIGDNRLYINQFPLYYEDFDIDPNSRYIDIDKEDCLVIIHPELDWDLLGLIMMAKQVSRKVKMLKVEIEKIELKDGSKVESYNDLAEVTLNISYLSN